MLIHEAIAGVKLFFDGGYFAVNDIATSAEFDPEKMQRQNGEDCEPFDHCFVDQGGGGPTGDDFHGTVYFHVGEESYLVVDF